MPATRAKPKPGKSARSARPGKAAKAAAPSKSGKATAVPTAAEILAEMKPLGRESYKKVMLSHGVKEPIWGVSIADMKKIQKRAGIKSDYRLALDLFDSGVYDAMYFAGLLADDARMTRKDLQRWVSRSSGMLCDYTVPWVAAGSPHGHDIALEWIESDKPGIACAGWGTLSSLASITPDSELDLAELKALLQRVQKTIQAQPDRVRYAMNNFVIALGCYCKPLTAAAEAAARAYGKVHVDMGDTACRVPDAIEYIDKVRKRGTLGRKRASCKC
jgi:3-methyladenine DNA glycosylase AlkD